MRFAKRLLMIAGAVALAGILGLAIAPKAAHALVAALVQVVNSPTTAVPTVLAPAASNIYLSICSVGYNGATGNVCDFSAVPPGQTLVVTALTIWSESTPGADPQLAQLALPVYPAGPFWFAVPMVRQASSSTYDYYAGTLAGPILIPAGTWPFSPGPQCQVFLNGASTTSNSQFQCTISGYLVPSS
jgi:hypothetical protein